MPFRFPLAQEEVTGAKFSNVKVVIAWQYPPHYSSKRKQSALLLEDLYRHANDGHHSRGTQAKNPWK